jgi:thiol-disulfide isomerase/thioredoxin
VNTEKKEFAQMKHSLSVQVWIRCVLGVAVILGVVAIATGWETSFFRFSFVDTVRAQEHLIGVFHPEKPAFLTPSAAESQPALADEGSLPDLGGAVAWLNSAPLSPESLRGKVVLVNFWTYSCINSLRELPYMKSWAERYKDAGLVVIGVHAPEFGFEGQRANVENAVRELSITYPVAIDGNHRIGRLSTMNTGRPTTSSMGKEEFVITISGRDNMASPSASSRNF